MLRLISDAEITRVRPAVEELIASFRAASRALVAALAEDTVGEEWLVHDHGEHCRFEHAVTGSWRRAWRVITTCGGCWKCSDNSRRARSAN
ncbi:hypothetical protein BBK82_12675 [Lentzea guizhouensis]|uniref:Uncharacterized protein n=1 Tax=Lentzea guizhouensis TaxID=1586287 RepID=A0A1B2HGF6_9PSEU|nr:hypothetical protein [Lentzea guizhouensis]ANZ36797.1 hypothetical protein BBK82_12675 [Lentzea guizhouensis]